ncbi:MAG: hypothetical protein ACO3PD_12680 [Acidimicrobiales bacterium]
MKLARLGSFHQSRLSFMRVLLRRLVRENWTFERVRFDIDPPGVGVAVYEARGPERTYSLVAFAHDLAADQRSDRVIAQAWDATFALVDGVVDAATIERLAANVPLQEAGRVSAGELTLSRANRSVRLFDHVVDRLAAGEQPDSVMLDEVGYLMRTTAVYGSGKFGLADRERIAGRPELAGPFQAEMLTVFLIRAFSLDLVEHLAKRRSPSTAVAMEPALRRTLGVGNATGLGMAPFVINHPSLFSNWIVARETALARVRALPEAELHAQARFLELLERARLNAAGWRSVHEIQVEKVATLVADLDALGAVAPEIVAGAKPWDRLVRWAEDSLGLEGQEQLVSLVLEPYGALVDDLATEMGADEDTVFDIDGSMTTDDLTVLVTDLYGWALGIDWTDSDETARAWYVSEDKLEPRMGERHEEAIEPYESPLAPGRDAARLHADLVAWDGEPIVAAFLLAHPEHRFVTRRVQQSIAFPYAEIRENTISSDVLPIDMLRCKLSYFGATHFDPRSDRWVRIIMFRHAPFPDELDGLREATVDDWCYPPLEAERTR